MTLFKLNLKETNPWLILLFSLDMFISLPLESSKQFISIMDRRSECSVEITKNSHTLTFDKKFVKVTVY